MKSRLARRTSRSKAADRYRNVLQSSLPTERGRRKVLLKNRVCMGDGVHASKQTAKEEHVQFEHNSSEESVRNTERKDVKRVTEKRTKISSTEREMATKQLIERTEQNRCIEALLLRKQTHNLIYWLWLKERSARAEKETEKSLVPSRVRQSKDNVKKRNRIEGALLIATTSSLVSWLMEQEKAATKRDVSAHEAKKNEETKQSLSFPAVTEPALTPERTVNKNGIENSFTKDEEIDLDTISATGNVVSGEDSESVHASSSQLSPPNDPVHHEPVVVPSLLPKLRDSLIEPPATDGPVYKPPTVGNEPRGVEPTFRSVSVASQAARLEEQIRRNGVHGNTESCDFSVSTPESLTFERLSSPELDLPSVVTPPHSQVCVKTVVTPPTVRTSLSLVSFGGYDSCQNGVSNEGSISPVSFVAKARESIDYLPRLVVGNGTRRYQSNYSGRSGKHPDTSSTTSLPSPTVVGPISSSTSLSPSDQGDSKENTLSLQVASKANEFCRVALAASSVIIGLDSRYNSYAQAAAFAVVGVTAVEMIVLLVTAWSKDKSPSTSLYQRLFAANNLAITIGIGASVFAQRIDNMLATVVLAVVLVALAQSVASGFAAVARSKQEPLRTPTSYWRIVAPAGASLLFLALLFKWSQLKV